MSSQFSQSCLWIFKFSLKTGVKVKVKRPTFSKNFLVSSILVTYVFRAWIYLHLARFCPLEIYWFINSHNKMWEAFIKFDYICTAIQHEVKLHIWIQKCFPFVMADEMGLRIGKFDGCLKCHSGSGLFCFCIFHLFLRHFSQKFLISLLFVRLTDVWQVRPNIYTKRQIKFNLSLPDRLEPDLSCDCLLVLFLNKDYTGRDLLPQLYSHTKQKKISVL